MLENTKDPLNDIASGRVMKIVYFLGNAWTLKGISERSDKRETAYNSLA